MPLLGTRDITPLLAHAPTVTDLAQTPMTLPGIEVLQVSYEIDPAAIQSALPKALHPSIPPTVSFVFWRGVQGPLGAFQLAQVRVGSRAGPRPRGFLLASYCDSEPAAEVLRTRWGYNCRPGGVRLQQHYDRVTGAVVVADQTILQVSLIDPETISGGDIQYTANMNLARVPLEGGTRPWLVQVDPEYTFYRAQRGRPLVEQFVRAAWAAEELSPVYPITASFCACDVLLPRVRYLVDPDAPIRQGTKTIGE